MPLHPSVYASLKALAISSLKASCRNITFSSLTFCLTFNASGQQAGISVSGVAGPDARETG